MVVMDVCMLITNTQENNPPRKRRIEAVEPAFAPTFNIKKVKLVLRRPPFPITNPKQRPPPAKYNSSLATFLTSYTTHNGRNIDEKTLEQEIITDAAVMERTEQFRKEGRFIPGTDAIFGFNVDTTSSFTTPQRTQKDHWDHVVEAAISESKLWRRRPSGRQIAAQVASKIQAYWDGQEAKKEKVKFQEERRLRALAKHTIKMVTQEWKKAVFVSASMFRLTFTGTKVCLSIFASKKG